MPLVEPVVAFFVFLAQSFTSSVVDNYTADTSEQDLLREGRLDCFTEFDADDAIFQEFDAPDNETGPTAWKSGRPDVGKFFLRCFKTVLLIQIGAGASIGLVALVIVILDFNTADLCYEKTLSWNTMPRSVQSIRVAGQVVEGFLIQLWHFSLVLSIFGWSAIKEVNLLLFNLLAAFADASYRLLLQVFDVYKKPWMSYPLNVLFAFMVIANSVIIGRHVQPSNRKQAFKVAAILSSQFIVGMPVTFVLVYKVIPWYNKHDEIEKAIIAGACPLLVSIPKVIARLAAQKLTIVHPGLLHILVGILYGSAAIVFRVMQAELTNFGLFVALGVGHAIIDVLERLTITMRDHAWEYLYRKLRGTLGRRPLQMGKFRTPRSMRLVADMSIQSILSESTSLVTAVGFIQIYKFMYSDTVPSFTDPRFIWSFFGRCAAGLAIDAIFNTLSIWLQAMQLNVAVLRVWKKKWRSHLLLNLVFTVMTVLYFTEYLFAVVRAKHDTSHMTRFAFNCSMPFSKF